METSILLAVDWHIFQKKSYICPDRDEAVENGWMDGKAIYNKLQYCTNANFVKHIIQAKSNTAVP